MLPRVGCALGQGSEVQGIPSACGSKGQALCRTPAQDPFLSCRASEKLSPFGTGWHQGKGLLLLQGTWGVHGHPGCALRGSGGAPTAGAAVGGQC